MLPNAKGSEQLAVLASIDPASQAAGTSNSDWVSCAQFHSLLAFIQTGTMGTNGTLLPSYNRQPMPAALEPRM